VITRNDDKSAFERMFLKKPTLKYLKVFGCHAYVYVVKEKRKKWDRKAVKCILLGYTNNGYKLLNIDDRKIIYSRNAKFNEY